MLSIGRGFPSNPLRVTFAWEESWEGLEAGVKRKKRRVVKMNKKVVSNLFIMVYPFCISIGWIEVRGKKLFVGNDRDSKQGS